MTTAYVLGKPRVLSQCTCTSTSKEDMCLTLKIAKLGFLFLCAIAPHSSLLLETNSTLSSNAPHFIFYKKILTKMKHKASDSGYRISCFFSDACRLSSDHVTHGSCWFLFSLNSENQLSDSFLQRLDCGTKLDEISVIAKRWPGRVTEESWRQRAYLPLGKDLPRPAKNPSEFGPFHWVCLSHSSSIHVNRGRDKQV